MRTPVFVAALVVAVPAIAQQKPPPGGQAKDAVYFGDLHVHTGLSADAYSRTVRVGPAWACDYARYHAGLDFVGIADHGENLGGTLNSGDWKDYITAINAKNDEIDAVDDGTGRFVTLLGYEWTSKVYGHKNVFFKGSRVPKRCIHSNLTYEPDADSDPVLINPRHLWTLLRAWRAKQRRKGRVADFLSIPHTPAKLDPSTTGAPTDWSFVDGEVQPIVEIFSKHGSSEVDSTLLSTSFPPLTPVKNLVPGRTYQAALNRWFSSEQREGYRLGAIASTDTHDGQSSGHVPDREQLRFGPESLYSWRTTGGLVAVHARPPLTRAKVFDALKARRCYGTSGARIRLTVTAETDLEAEQPMGSKLEFTPEGGFVRITVHALGEPLIDGTNRVIERVEVYAGDSRSHGNALRLVCSDVPNGDDEVVYSTPLEGPQLFYVVAYQQATRDWINPDGLGPNDDGGVPPEPAPYTYERAWASPVWVVPAQQ